MMSRPSWPVIASPAKGSSAVCPSFSVTSAAGAPLACATFAGNRFIEGEPMKPATNMLAGLS